MVRMSDSERSEFWDRWAGSYLVTPPEECWWVGVGRSLSGQRRILRQPIVEPDSHTRFRVDSIIPPLLAEGQRVAHGTATVQ